MATYGYNNVAEPMSTPPQPLPTPPLAIRPRKPGGARPLPTPPIHASSVSSSESAISRTNSIDRSLSQQSLPQASHPLPTPPVRQPFHLISPTVITPLVPNRPAPPPPVPLMTNRPAPPPPSLSFSPSPAPSTRPKLGLQLSSGLSSRPATPPSLSVSIQTPSPTPSTRPKLGLQLPSNASSRPSTPSLSLQIPALGSNNNSSTNLAVPGGQSLRQRPSAHSLTKLSIPSSGNTSGGDNSSGSDFDPRSDMDEDENYIGYYGQPVTTSMHPTLRPSQPTATPANPNPHPHAHSSSSSLPAQTIESLIAEVNSLEMQSQSSEDESDVSGRAERKLRAQQPAIDWSEAQFEDIRRLGEGAGGAVNLVKHIASGRVMARKTIPSTGPQSRDPQLRRELSFLSSCVHENITKFYGAYVSNPNSRSGAEICLLMEFCEGMLFDCLVHDHV
jgi:mitogen-activated protein kinase kinase